MKYLPDEYVLGPEIEEAPDFVPKKYWFNLKECCALKGLNYKTACNKTFLQPNQGFYEKLVGGRRVWSYQTVCNWLAIGDEEIIRPVRLN